MSAGVYFNEFDPHAAAWLRELIREGYLPDGEVDERSIADVVPADLAGFRQCHFFAGIGGWSHALRLAGWADDRPVWTGSCPCQPYSPAGKGEGDKDPRNLWPEFFRLIRECRPDCVFGEQVEGAIRHGWLDGVQRDLEGEGYAVGHCVLGAHSVGAPHIRQRLYWVADAGRAVRRAGATDGDRVQGRHRVHERPQGAVEAAACGADGELADSEEPRGWPHTGAVRGGETEGVRGPQGEDGRRASECAGRLGDRGSARGVEHAASSRREQGCGDGDGTDRSAGGVGQGEPAGTGVVGVAQGDASSTGLQERVGDGRVRRGAGRAPAGQAAVLRGDTGGLDDADGERRDGQGVHAGQGQPRQAATLPERAGESGVGFWDAFDLLPCRDGKSRRVEPGTFPLAHGVSGRVAVVRPDRRGAAAVSEEDIRWVNRAGALKGFGNAIVPQDAVAFIEAYLEVRNHR